MGGRNTALICFIFFMLRNLITATLVATAPMTTHRAVVTQAITKTETVINVDSSQFYEYTYQDDLLTLAKLYNVKELSKPIDIGTATFEYKQIDVNTWRNDGSYHTYSCQYYKVTRNTTTQESLTLTGIGNFNNETLLPYAQDVVCNKVSGYIGMVNIPQFFATQDYTLNMLKNCVDPISMATLGASVEVDSTDLSNGYILDTKETTEQYYIVCMDINYDTEQQLNPDNLRFTTYNYLTGITVGYNYSITIPDTNYEVVDIPGLMFEILGMPFAWLSTAFNLTLFPGTPYAINISHVFFAVIGALILVIIIKRILK